MRRYGLAASFVLAFVSFVCACGEMLSGTVNVDFDDHGNVEFIGPISCY